MFSKWYNTTRCAILYIYINLIQSLQLTLEDKLLLWVVYIKSRYYCNKITNERFSMFCGAYSKTQINDTYFCNRLYHSMVSIRHRWCRCKLYLVLNGSLGRRVELNLMDSVIRKLDRLRWRKTISFWKLLSFNFLLRTIIFTGELYFNKLKTILTKHFK